MSYHNKEGTVINDATHYISGVETLKTTATRPQGLHFVKFACNLDFSTLGVDPTNRNIINFYASLPITTNIVTEVEGNNYPSEEDLLELQAVVATATTSHAEAVAGGLDRLIGPRLLAITLALMT